MDKILFCNWEIKYILNNVDVEYSFIIFESPKVNLIVISFAISKLFFKFCPFDFFPLLFIKDKIIIQKNKKNFNKKKNKKTIFITFK